MGVSANSCTCFYIFFCACMLIYSQEMSATLLGWMDRSIDYLQITHKSALDYITYVHM